VGSRRLEVNICTHICAGQWYLSGAVCEKRCLESETVNGWSEKTTDNCIELPTSNSDSGDDLETSTSNCLPNDSHKDMYNVLLRLKYAECCDDDTLCRSTT
jgi:hypothetical protein